MTVYVDADHVHDLVTRRFITEILVMLSNTPIMAQSWWPQGLLRN
jgi:hypothetical protein